MTKQHQELHAMHHSDSKAYHGNKSIAAYLLLCWFLGFIGAHRYYAGKTGSAIAMTILTITFVGIIVTSIWAFIDLIIGICSIGNPGKIFKK